MIQGRFNNFTEKSNKFMLDLFHFIGGAMTSDGFGGTKFLRDEYGVSEKQHGSTSKNSSSIMTNCENPHAQWNIFQRPLQDNLNICHVVF